MKLSREDGDLQMRYLPINDWLNEDTRLQTITLSSRGAYDLHRGRGDDSTILYITEHGDASKILLMCKEEIWNTIFEVD